MKDLLEYQSINEFLNDIEWTTIELEMELWQYHTPLQIFRYRFKKALIIDNAEAFLKYGIDSVNNFLEEYLQESFCLDVIQGFQKISFTTFNRNEKNLINNLNKSELPKNIASSVKNYYAFLNENMYNFFRIDVLKKDNNNLYSHFLSLLGEKVNAALIDANKIETSFNAMLTQIDYYYLCQLLKFDKSEDKDHPPKNVYNAIDLEYYKNPILLQEFEEEKIVYLKIFKSYIKEALYKRKETLRLEKLPQVYLYLENYADALIPKKNIEQEKTIAKSSINIDYPKYIFNNSEDYRLFNELMKVVSNQTQVSYIFRVMSEKEKPAKIIVKDTPFREWFNAQHYKIKLDNHTQTLINSENKDRKALYEIANNLLSSSSKIDE